MILDDKTFEEVIDMASELDSLMISKWTMEQHAK